MTAPSATVAVWPPSISASLRLGGGVDDDGAAAGEERGELVAQLLAELVVEVGERLVEEDEAGVLDDGAGEGGALLLAAGELLRAAAEHGGEVEEVGGLAHAAVDLGACGRPATRSGEAMFSATVMLG